MATATSVHVMINDERIKLEGEELASFMADQENNIAYEASLEKLKKEKESARAAVFAKLGLTAEEAELLLG